MEKKNIYESIAAVLADVGTVGKDGFNTAQKFKYRSVEAVMNALNPALAKHKVFIVPQVLSQKQEERTNRSGGSSFHFLLNVKFTFYAEDGSSIEAITIGEASDSGDKGVNKAMSAAFKYACFQTFCIPTEDVVEDADKNTPDESYPAMATREQCEKLLAELARTGIGRNNILRAYGVKDVRDLTDRQCREVLAKLEETPDRTDKAIKE